MKFALKKKKINQKEPSSEELEHARFGEAIVGLF
jgi:hypothetical protein